MDSADSGDRFEPASTVYVDGDGDKTMDDEVYSRGSMSRDDEGSMDDNDRDSRSNRDERDPRDERDYRERRDSRDGRDRPSSRRSDRGKSSTYRSRDNTPKATLYVTGFLKGTSAKRLAEIFEKYGPLAQVNVLPPRQTDGEQYAFVAFRKITDMNAVLADVGDGIILDDGLAIDLNKGISCEKARRLPVSRRDDRRRDRRDRGGYRRDDRDRGYRRDDRNGPGFRDRRDDRDRGYRRDDWERRDGRDRDTNYRRDSRDYQDRSFSPPRRGYSAERSRERDLPPPPPMGDD